jgi:hypothetical protein
MTWTLERIYARCEETEEGCLLWNGGMAKRYPIAQEPAPDRAHGQRQIHVRRKVWELAKGKPAPAGPRYVLVAKCGEERCVAEDCLKLITKGERLKQAVKAGAFQSLVFRARVAAARRRNSKLSDDGAAEIRSSNEPGHVLAARHDISAGYACAIKAGTSRRDYSSPFAALQPAPGRRQA